MIQNNYINIVVNKQNSSKLFKILNKTFNIGEIIEVPIYLLTKCSHYKITAKCDVCGKEKIISYQKYNCNIQKYGLYTCNNLCAQIKNKLTSVEKFGVEHFSKTEKFKSKLRKNKPIKIKIIKDLEYYKEYAKKMKSIKLSKYGNENYNNKEKNKKTCLEKYGVENVFQLETIKNKIRETNLKKYGVEYPSQSKEILIKILNSRHKNMDYNISIFIKFKYQVRKLTLKNKNKLFKNWDGYDYYDREYIKNNFSHKSGNKYYPTIDHKKSVLYCFKNNIPVEECADIKNLCITTRSNNSKKHSNNELIIQ